MILIGLLGQAVCASEGKAALANAAVPALTKARRERCMLIGIASGWFYK